MTIDAATASVAARPLGLADAPAFQWRRRAGHPAYRLARTGEASGDWEHVVAVCREVLAVDPQHLEAAWLLAIGLGKLGRIDEIVAPLYTAVAGDFGKWAHASLEHPALAAFLAAPIGKAWRQRVELDRATFTAALARSLYVTAAGDLFAYDAEARRWYRLTNTYGAVLGGLAVPAADRIVYVARLRGKRPPHATTLAAGLVDLSIGRTLSPIELGTKGPISVAYASTTKVGIWIRRPAGTAAKWLLEYGGKLVPLPATSTRPAGPWLEVTGKRVRPRAIPVYDITADFDDKGLASAIRIGRSNRILSIPSPGLIDGNSVRWSPDRTRLAFVAQLDDECAPGAVNAAAFIADTTTGALQELERAAGGLTVTWLSDRKPVVAGDRGVSILDLDGAAPVPLAGADALLTPRARPKCMPPETPDEPPPADDADLPESAAELPK